ncbi:hypothetical protein [Aquimarina muelleri]|uniref:Uncharacterized protein n=1 Tax=Aquimarina muelleri TaxID=279356 RepID=A0A918N3E3_9FLAO|nr:hypothetical protein [Aquimarina muelleri]MCX2765056.1 hypothetical protein [Aquimarina muelleri]GGX19107.1 hypothetical protein GCM10007384_20560 [Aquimarina muelleri]
MFYVVAIVIAIAAFLHIFFNPESKNLSEIRKKHSEAKLERNKLNQDILILITDYTNNKVTSSQLNSSLPDIIDNYKQREIDALQLFELLNKEKEKEKIFGFKNIHTFLYALSLPLCFLIISVVMLFFSVSEDLKQLSKAITFLGFTIMFISLFFLSWIFLPISDMPYWSYILSIFICAFLISFFTKLILNWRIKIFKKKYSIDRTKFLESALELSANIIDKSK